MKTIALICACLFASQAYAQSSVTLYGVIDTGLTYTNNQHGGSNIEQTSGKLSGARFGFKGAEDLGGGNKAIFVLENGFNSANGTLGQGGRLFGRQAYVGLQNDHLGQVTLGRQYAPVQLYVGYLSAALRFGTSNITEPFDLDMMGGSVRFNNSVTYTTPDFYGFTLSAQYAMSNQPSSATTSGIGNNREYGAALQYNRGPLRAGIGFADLSNPNSASNQNGATVADYPGSFPLWIRQFDTNASGKASNAGVTIGNQKIYAASAVYTLGNWNFGGLVSRTVTDQLAITQAQTAGLNTNNGNFFYNSYELSAAYNTSPANMIGVAGKYTNGALQASTQRYSQHWWEFNISDDYLLSKRTDVYISFSYEKASGLHNVAFLTLNAPSSTTSQVAITAGLRHRF